MTRLKTSSGWDFDVRLARRATGIGQAGSAPPAGGADTTEYLAFDGDHNQLAVALMVTDRGDGGL